METIIEKEPRERVVLHLARRIVTRLRRRHADNRQTISRIVEDVLDRHLDHEETVPCKND